MLESHILNNDNIKHLLKILESSKKLNRPLTLYIAKRFEPALFNGISAYTMLKNETDWSTLEDSIIDKASDFRESNLQIFLITRHNTIELSVKSIS